MNLPNDREVRLMVQIEPINKETDNIIRTQAGSACVGNQIGHISALLFGVSLISGAESAPNKVQIVLALEALIDLVAEFVKPLKHIVEGAGEEPDFPLVLV